MDPHPDAPNARPHPQNTAGPFYVQNGECLACGAPELEAPTMMGHDERGHCFFSRQPTTVEETNAAMLSIWASCCGAVRYGGQDRERLIRLAEIGSAECCDHRLKTDPKPVKRTHVSFEFLLSEAATPGTLASRQIMEYFGSFLKGLGGGGGRVLNFLCSNIASSFNYEWGAGSDVYTATFILDLHRDPDWLLRILRDDHHPTTGFSISIHKALERDSRFRRIQWFTEEEWEEGDADGRARPY